MLSHKTVIQTYQNNIIAKDKNMLREFLSREIIRKMQNVLILF